MGVFGDFYELGGNSLLTTLVTQKVNESVNRQFRTPTFLQSGHINIEMMSRIIDSKEEDKQKKHLVNLIKEFVEKGVLGSYIVYDVFDKIEVPEEILEVYAPDIDVLDTIDEYAMADFPEGKKICHVSYNVGSMEAPPSMSLTQSF